MDTLPEESTGRHSLDGHTGAQFDDIDAFMSVQAELAVAMQRRRIQGYTGRHRSYGPQHRVYEAGARW